MTGFPSRFRPRLLACSLALLSAFAPAISFARDAVSSPRSGPEWLDGAVIYAVVPPLFGEEKPFRSVTDRLDELQELGVDALWFSPINETDDPSAISYAITNYFNLRSDFGTPDDFRTLVREAKARGMRILMDFVPNHTSIAHPFYRDAQLQGPASPFFDFYERNDEGVATHYFNWHTLKNLNYDNPDVQRMMISAFSHWIREFDVDGFRIDAVWGPRERNPAFLSKLTTELRRIKPEVFLLAEASAHDPFYVRNGFDSAYDWTGELGKWAWEKVFEDPKHIAPRLDAALRATEGKTPAGQITRFLNNNDTGERFITRYGVDTTRVAAILLLTLPGIPVIYSGDEVGAEYEPYKDPAPIKWVDRHGLQALYKKLTHLRGTKEALQGGRFERIPVKGNPSAYVFARDATTAGKSDDFAFVALNFGGATTLELSPSRQLQQKLVGSGELVDALTGRSIPLVRAADGRLRLKMPASSGVVLMPKSPSLSSGSVDAGLREARLAGATQSMPEGVCHPAGLMQDVDLRGARRCQ
ncbi:MAG: alpha-amylase family glycosyl hydrolase [Myxococcaceae bacterium]